jgi:FixJ family two-component response regulator
MVFRGHRSIFCCIDHGVLPRKFPSSGQRQNERRGTLEPVPSIKFWNGKPERFALAFRAGSICTINEIKSRESFPLLSGLAQIRMQRPGRTCLVLDVTLPDLNGLDLQKRVALDRVDMPIIFITGYGDVPTTVQAMKAGAVEFLTKPFGDDVLLNAIRHAIERSRTALRGEAEIRALRDRYASLSRREREVMALVVSGLLNKQVGGELGISEITVKAHRGKVMRKMKAGSLADLVNMAATLRLASVPKG